MVAVLCRAATPEEHPDGLLTAVPGPAIALTLLVRVEQALWVSLWLVGSTDDDNEHEGASHDGERYPVGDNEDQRLLGESGQPFEHAPTGPDQSMLARGFTPVTVTV